MINSSHIHDVEKYFKDCLIDINHPLSGDIKFDTPNWQRYACPGSKDSKTSARYRAHSDGRATLKFACLRCQITKNFPYKGSLIQLPPGQRIAVQVENEKKRVEEAKRQQSALTKMRVEWEEAKPCMGHQYFDSKGLSISENDGLRIDSAGYVLCPIRVITGELISTQKISFKGLKLFHGGLSPKNGFHIFGSIENDDEIYFSEGIATAFSIRNSINKTVICVYGKHFDDIGMIIANAYPNKKLIYCCDVASIGEKVSSLDNAKAAIAVTGGTYALPDFKDIHVELKSEIKRSDFNDLHMLLMAKGLTRAAALDIVRQQIQHNLGNIIMTENALNENKLQKPCQISHDEVMRRIKKLSLMDEIEYERARKDEAEKMDMRVNILDDKVVELRRHSEKTSDNVLFPVINPWGEAVDLCALLNDVEQTLNRFVAFQSEHEARAIAFWVIHSYCFDAFDLTPFLFISSPEKRCGKSTLLDLLRELVLNPLVVTNITPSAFFRSIEKFKPTLLIEEVDAFMKENEELRGIINGSNRRNLSFVLRCVGEQLEPKQFHTYCPKILCGIGKLPETIEDRAIIIRLSRKMSDEKKEKRRLRNKSQQTTFSELRSKCARFAQDNIEKLILLDYERAVEPQVPTLLDSRASDNWEPLIAIATLADNKWLDAVHRAAIYLSGVKKQTPSIGVELLTDIRDVFDDLKVYKLFSKELLEKLNRIDEAPWATFYYGKPMTPRQLGNLLRDYEIQSKDVRIGVDKAKGFERLQFEKAWKSYISNNDNTISSQSAPNFSETSETARQVNNNEAFDASPNALSRIEHRDKLHKESSCLGNASVSQARQMQMSRIEKAPQPNNDKGCLAVSDKAPILEGVVGAML